MLVDRASNVKGRGVRIVLEGSSDILIEQALKFKYREKNNQTEYEALIIDMILSLEMGAIRLKEKSDSELVVNQVVREYQEKEPQLIKYLHKVQILSTHFKSFEMKYVPWEQNFKENFLSKVATKKTVGYNQTIIQYTLIAPKKICK